MFYERFVNLCNSKNLFPTAVAQELGFSSGTVTWWKKGRSPRDTALQKIAAYFGVSVDYLLGKEEEKSPALSESELDARILKAWRQLDEKQVEEALRYIEFLKSKG